MDEVLVSVYCMAYNHEKYIRDALEGFVSQKTNFKYEVIVHDDASTDGTADIIKEYAEKYSDIIKPIFQTENQYSKKVPIFKQYVFPKMRGKYIASCEGDDYWNDENKLQMQVDFLEKHEDYAACVHNTVFWDMRTQEKRTFSQANEEYDISMQELIEWDLPYHTSSVVYRKTLRNNIPEFVTKTLHVGDYPMALWMRLNGKIRYLPRVMSVYRFNTEGSWTARHSSEEKKIANGDKIQRMLEMFDSYSGKRYHKYVQKKIDMISIYKALSTNSRLNYYKVIKQYGIKTAVSYWAQRHLKTLYNLQKRLRELL